MSFIGDLFDSSKGAGYQAQEAASKQQADELYRQQQEKLAQQQAFTQAVGAQAPGAIAAQTATLGQLQDQASGMGPSVARNQLAEATAKNTARTGAMLAGQRGASANVGLAGRNAAMAGSGAQQEAARQAATLRAQEQLGAQRAIGDLAGQQLGQAQSAQQLGISGTTAAQGNVLGALNKQSDINAQIAKGNQAFQAGVTGSLFDAVGGMIPGMAEGGEIGSGISSPTQYDNYKLIPGEDFKLLPEATYTPKTKPVEPGEMPIKEKEESGIESGSSTGDQNNPNYAAGKKAGAAMGKLLPSMGGSDDDKEESGGSSPSPAMMSKLMGSGEESGGGMDAGAAMAMNKGGEAHGLKKVSDENGVVTLEHGDGHRVDLVKSKMGKAQREHIDKMKLYQSDSGMGSMMKFLPLLMMANKGGEVPAMLSPGEKYLGKSEAEAVANGRKNVAQTGKMVPGRAKVPGDSLKNDTVPAKLEKGGVVIPRSVMNSNDPAEQARKFVAAIVAKRGLKRK